MTTTAPSSAVRPARPHRRLQWLTVVVGFLFFVALLIEAALAVLHSGNSALPVTTIPGTASGQVAVVATSIIQLVLAGATMFLAAACVGRYRLLAKTAGVLLFLGAFARLVWPVLNEALFRSSVWSTGRLGPIQVLPYSGGPALLTPELLTEVHWFFIVPALVLTFLGLIGLIVFAPPRPKAAPASVEPDADRTAATRRDAVRDDGGRGDGARDRAARDTDREDRAGSHDGREAGPSAGSHAV